MFWLMVVVVALVVFAAAGVAAGAGGTLRDPAGDPPPIPEHAGPVTAEDLGDVRFPVVLRGYRMDAVDALLDRISGEIAARDARIADLENRGVRAGHPDAPPPEES